MNPEGNADHAAYIDALCRDVDVALRRQMEAAFAARQAGRAGGALQDEVTQHARFCQDKCRAFYGRREALEVSFYLYILVF